MKILEELSRLPQKEIKDLLDNNKYLKKGAIAKYKDSDDLYRVFDRYADKIYLWRKRRKEVLTSFISDCTPLSYKDYREILSRKYEEGTIVNTLDKLEKYTKKTLYKVYGEDRVDIQNTKDSLVISIYFPEILVKNSLEMEHTITDVYLRLLIYRGSNNFWLSSFGLWRETFTPEEVNSSYLFSHINNIPGEFGTNWCFGNTDFGNYISKCTKKINPRDILFLITQFQAYLQWESIEGTPYRYISKIRPFKITEADVSTSLSPLYYKKLVSIVYQNIDNFRYNLSASCPDFYIDLYEETIQQIKEIISPYILDEFKLRNIGGIQGDVIPLTRHNVVLKAGNTFNFKGETLTCRIIDSKKNITQKQIDQLYPREICSFIIDNVKSIIVNDFKEFIIKYKIEND